MAQAKVPSSRSYRKSHHLRLEKYSLRGRVASLLEVGTGFHPELTGRENIYLNGTILGMTRAEIKNKFDEIVAFSEIDKFLDTPVKRYSSGMYVRLAFAVAAHLEPEILLVDEVLAVGDAAFQEKCLGKMGDVAREGRTILFVSHSMIAVQSICKRVLLFEKGQLISDGKPREVVSKYLNGTKNQGIKSVCYVNTKEYGSVNDAVKLKSLRVVPTGGAAENGIMVDTPINIEIEFWNFLQDALLNFSLVLYDLQGTPVLNSFSEPKKFPMGTIKGVCHIPKDLLNSKTYTIRLLIVKDSSLPLLDEENVALLEVQDIERRSNWYGEWIGTVRPRLRWTTEVLECA